MLPDSTDTNLVATDLVWAMDAPACVKNFKTLCPATLTENFDISVRNFVVLSRDVIEQSVDYVSFDFVHLVRGGDHFRAG